MSSPGRRTISALAPRAVRRSARRRKSRALRGAAVDAGSPPDAELYVRLGGDLGAPTERSTTAS